MPTATRPTYDALKIGDRAPTFQFGPVTLAMILRYAGASGDFNPLHNDYEYARAAGYPGIFAMGMMTAGYLARAVTDWVGPQHIRRYKVRFLDQVWPGDVLTCEVVVAAKRDENQEVDLDLSVRNQNGVEVLRGNATVVLP